MSRAHSFVAVEIEGLEDAGAGHHPDVFAVGDRRRRGHVLFALVVIAVAQEFLPCDRLGPLPVDAPQIQIAALGDVQEHAIAPDDRRRAAPAGSGSFQAIFSSGDHFTGRSVSPLVELRFGPRHCGQFSANAAWSCG